MAPLGMPQQQGVAMPDPEPPGAADAALTRDVAGADTEDSDADAAALAVAGDNVTALTAADAARDAAEASVDTLAAAQDQDG